METAELFATLGLDEVPGDGDLVVRTPINGSEIGRVPTDTPQALDGKITAAEAAHDVAAETEKVRIATLKYNDVKAALAEGYFLPPPGDCVTAAGEGLPAKWGGMGIHYINPKMLNITSTTPRVDGKSTHTDFTHPAILLYAPRADGSMALVGVENLVFLNAWKAAGNQAPPKFAGRSWDTMADNSTTADDEAHRFEPHHDQHVYFKKSRNPKDQLNPFSPSVDCSHHKPAKR